MQYILEIYHINLLDFKNLFNPLLTGIGIDGEVSKTLQKILTKQGMKFKLGTKVTGVKKEGGIVKVDVEAAKGGSKETVSY